MKKKRLTLFSLSSPPAHSFLHHPRSIMPSHISSYLRSSWLISFICPPPHRSLPYLDHSPHFPDGFSKTSTAGRPGCSLDGRHWWIRSQCSGQIFPESRPQSGRSACPSPPGHSDSRTTVFIQAQHKSHHFPFKPAGTGCLNALDTRRRLLSPDSTCKHSKQHPD